MAVDLVWLWEEVSIESPYSTVLDHPRPYIYFKCLHYFIGASNYLKWKSDYVTTLLKLFKDLPLV